MPASDTASAASTQAWKRRQAEDRTASTGKHAAKGKRFVILAATFNRPLTETLVQGARETLLRHGAAECSIAVRWVPGAFELPVAAAWSARSRPKPSAIITVGALIRGETAQYGILAQAVANGLTQVAVATGVPVTFGVIIAETIEQAQARADGSVSNRGVEAAEAALGLLQAFDA